MAAHVELAAVLAVMVVGATLGGRWVLWEFRHRRHQERVAAARNSPAEWLPPTPPFDECAYLERAAARDFARDQRTHATIMRDLTEGPPGDGTFAFTAFLPAAPDWREQTMAELSPEALEHPQGPQAAVSWGAGPGPGAGSSSALGPDQMSEGALWLPSAPSHGQRTWEQVEDRGSVPTGMLAPVPAHERLADTGEIASARQLAEWDADLRAQDDDAAAFIAGLAFGAERYRLEMAEAWA